VICLFDFDPEEQFLSTSRRVAVRLFLRCSIHDDDDNVVVACSRRPKGHDLSSGMQIKSAFNSIRFGYAFGWGVPSEEAGIRLGDLVISRPHETHGGIEQPD
jgi:hypothetical protein